MFVYFVILAISSAAVLQEFSVDAPFQTLRKYWRTSGNVQVQNDTFIELTNERVPNSSGLLISKKRIPIKSFKLEATLQMSSTTGSSHGDGMAIWITQAPLQSGKAFGGASKWKGAAIIFDTYKNGKMAVPSAQVLLNFDNKEYKIEDDGAGLVTKSCFLGDLRGKPFTVFFEYDERTYEISLDIQQEGQERKTCFKNTAFRMKVGQYLGISASNSDVTDTHMVKSIKLIDTSIKRTKKKYSPKEPVGEELKLGALENKYTKEELEEACKGVPRCELTMMYKTLGSIADELSLNLKLANARKESISKIYKLMEKTSQSVTYPSSAAKVLEEIHDIQDDAADKVSDVFTSIGDFMDKIEQLAGTYFSSANKPRNSNLTMFDTILFITQAVVIIVLVLLIRKLHSTNNNNAVIN